MTKKTILGWSYTFVAVFIHTPIWLYFVYHVLSQVNTPKFVWVMFGVYIGSTYVLHFITQLLKQVLDKEVLDIAGGEDLK